MTQPKSASLVGETVARWKAQGIARPGAQRADLDDIEQCYGVCLPEDLAQMFLAADGMHEGDMDDLMIRFWPINELKPAGEEVQDGDPVAYRGYFVFADYSLWTHGYAVRLDEGADAGTVALVGGAHPIPVASSTSMFLENYLRHPERLFAALRT